MPLPQAALPPPCTSMTIDISNAHSQARALIVDDDELFLQHCAQLMEEDGFLCSMSRTVADAKERLAREQFDLLVCDLVMPDGGGDALIAFANTLPSPPAIVPVTGLSRTEETVAALKAGGWSVVFKPIDPADFSRTLAWCARAHRAGRLTPARLEALHRISALANTEPNLQRILDQTLELLIGALRADAASVMLTPETPGSRHLSVAASYGLKQDVTAGTMQVGEHVAGWVALHRRPVRIAGALEHYPQFRNLRSNPSIAEALVAPITFRGQCAGVLSISATRAGRLGIEDLALVVAVAEALGAVVHRERTERNREHQDRLALLGRLAASVAHELRNPLAHLKATLQYVLKEAILPSAAPPDITEAFDEMLAGVDRMASLVDNLRGTSRRPSRSTETVDPNQLVQRARALVLPQLKHRLRVDVELSDVAPLQVDSGRILQILINLLVNAAQAIEQTPREGRVVVRTRQQDGFVIIEVADNGSGIPVEVAGHIFQPFFTTKGEGEGTGLGLSISRQIAREHGGELSFESTPGAGSTFALRLPIARRSQPRPTVLVVDDEEALLRAITRNLSETFEVLTAASPKAGLAIAKERKVALIIADVRMPGMTGLELTRELRSQGVRVPIALLTAAPENPAVRAAHQSGEVQAVLSKPWSATYLVGQALDLIEKFKE